MAGLGTTALIAPPVVIALVALWVLERVLARRHAAATLAAAQARVGAAGAAGPGDPRRPADAPPRSPALVLVGPPADLLDGARPAPVAPAPRRRSTPAA